MHRRPMPRWPGRRCSSTGRHRTPRRATRTTGMCWSARSRRAAWRPASTHRRASAKRRPTWPWAARHWFLRTARCWPNRNASATARSSSRPMAICSVCRVSACARSASVSQERAIDKRRRFVGNSQWSTGHRGPRLFACWRVDVNRTGAPNLSKTSRHPCRSLICTAVLARLGHCDCTAFRASAAHTVKDDVGSVQR